MAEPHIQLILDREAVPRTLRAALNRLNARVSIRSIEKALCDGMSNSVDVCVVLPGTAQTRDTLDRIIDKGTERACAMMVMTPEGVSMPRQLIDGPPEDRIAASPANADELTGRIQALCEIGRPMRRMREELTQLKRRDTEDFTNQLELAGRIQQSMLPKMPVNTSPLAISTLYLPANMVSGDIYHISQPTDQHFGFSLADATGHGLQAALLTILIQDIFCDTPSVNEWNQPLDPDGPLMRLSDELRCTKLADREYVTATHAIFDRSTHTIRWARAGMPYPILIRNGKAPQELKSQGGIISGHVENTFAIAEHQFEPGDTLLYYTDGLDALLTANHADRNGEGIIQSGWIKNIATNGMYDAFETIRESAADHNAWNADDITIIALTMNQ
jgi:serine phosphatase RsbU (regulator of sigma subunit)